MKDLNVLVFPAGTEVGQEICKSLRYAKNVRQLIGASSLKADPTEFTYKLAWPVDGTATNILSGWNRHVNEAIETLNIDYVFPAHDAVLEYVDSIRGAQVITSSWEACNICRSKSETYKKVKDVIRVPEIYATFPAGPIRAEYPAFLKPDKGQGSFGTRIISNYDEWTYGAKSGDLLLEYLPGPEYTVECFTSSKNGLMYIEARRRVATKAGICVYGEYTDVLPQSRNIAASLNEIFKFRGPWFFQLKEDKNGELVLLEVAPRIPGTAALSRANGVNLPLLALHEWEGDDLTITHQLNSSVISRTLTNRYKFGFEFDSVYVDYEDTLVIHERLNLQLVRFLFQCVEQQIPIYLLTKYANADLPIKLRTRRVYQLFDEIYQIPEDKEKYLYINRPDPIFIDDSHSERVRASHFRGALCFDPSQVEVLLDDRL